VLTVAWAVPDAQAEELSAGQLEVVNHSFEEPVVDGEIPGWERHFGSAGEGVREVVDDLAYDGEFSFLLDDPEDDVAYGLLSDPIEVTAGDDYEASYQVWVEHGVPSMYLYFYDADGAEVGRTAAHFRGLPTEEWVRVSLEGSAPEDAVSAGILIYSLQSSISRFYADQVELVRVVPPEITDLGVAMHTLNVRLSGVGELADGTPVGYIFSDGEPVSFNVVDLRDGELLDRHEIAPYSVASAIDVAADGAVHLSVRGPNDGSLWRYHPEAGELTRIATGVAGEGMLRTLDSDGQMLYGTTYPNANLYAVDLETDEIIEYGRMVERAVAAHREWEQCQEAADSTTAYVEHRAAAAFLGAGSPEVTELAATAEAARRVRDEHVDRLTGHSLLF
jgi:hypothetical protein